MELQVKDGNSGVDVKKVAQQNAILEVGVTIPNAALIDNCGHLDIVKDDTKQNGYLKTTQPSVATTNVVDYQSLWKSAELDGKPEASHIASSGQITNEVQNPKATIHDTSCVQSTVKKQSTIVCGNTNALAVQFVESDIQQPKSNVQRQITAATSAEFQPTLEGAFDLGRKDRTLFHLT